MSPVEVAQAYGMSEVTVWRWVAQGRIRVVQRQPGGPGNKTTLDPEDLGREVTRYLENPRPGPKPQGRDPLKPLKELAPV